MTLDEKVWERSVVALFEGLGNAHANAAWEENLAAPHAPPPGAPSLAAALDARPGCGSFISLFASDIPMTAYKIPFRTFLSQAGEGVAARGGCIWFSGKFDRANIVRPNSSGVCVAFAGHGCPKV